MLTPHNVFMSVFAPPVQAVEEPDELAGDDDDFLDDDEDDDLTDESEPEDDEFEDDEFEDDEFEDDEDNDKPGDPGLLGFGPCGPQGAATRLSDVRH